MKKQIKSPKGKRTQTGKSPIEGQLEGLKKLVDAVDVRTFKVEINVPVLEKPKENIDLIRELTKEIENWNTIFTIKISLVKLQRFDLASELRQMENRSIDAIKKITSSFKSYPNPYKPQP